jgi:hypothetical protein
MRFDLGEHGGGGLGKVGFLGLNNLSYPTHTDTHTHIADGKAHLNISIHSRICTAFTRTNVLVYIAAFSHIFTHAFTPLYTYMFEDMCIDYIIIVTREIELEPFVTSTLLHLNNAVLCHQTHAVTSFFPCPESASLQSLASHHHTRHVSARTNCMCGAQTLIAISPTNAQTIPRGLSELTCKTRSA